LNDNFYHYALHQHHQDPNPYPWPTPEQFRATIKWPRGGPIFQEEVGPAGEKGPIDDQGDAHDQGGGRADEDEDMADHADYFIGED